MDSTCPESLRSFQNAESLNLGDWSIAETHRSLQESPVSFEKTISRCRKFQSRSLSSISLGSVGQLMPYVVAPEN